MDKTIVERSANHMMSVPQAQHIRLGDLPDPNPELFDKQRFAVALLNMKGSRSIRELAAELNLSDSFLNKAVNGHVSGPPSKRTMLKLLSAKTNVLANNRRELAQSAGYDADWIDWGNTEVENADHREVSATEAITRYYGESDFLACGNLMKTLSEHGYNGDMSSYFYRDKGYFEVKDEETGQTIVGINLYCNPETSGEKAVFSLVFSLALTYNNILSRKDIKDKIVVIMTNNEEIFNGCQTLSFEQSPKSTIAVLFADDHTEVQQEAVLSGERLISLLD